jgi:hypothetical protein
MDASDIIRKIRGQATLQGFNTLLLKEKQPAATYDNSGCCGFYDTSNCQWDVPKNYYPPLFSSYEFRNLVNTGLVANGCNPTNKVSITKQTNYVMPGVVYTVPLGNS